MISSRQIVQQCTRRSISSSTKTSTTTVSTSIGEKSNRFLAHYDKLIHNVQKRRSEHGHQRNLSLTEKILYGHGLDKQNYLQHNKINVSAFAASSSSFSGNTIQNVHENLIPSCDNILLKNDYAFLPGGLLFKNNNNNNHEPSSSVFKEALGMEDPIFSGHAMTQHNHDAGVLSTLCVGGSGLEDTTPRHSPLDDILSTFPSTKTATDDELSLPPKIIGVRLDGTLSGWTTPKDICLHISDLLTKHRQNDKNQSIILEYHGPGTDNVSCHDRAEICAMTSELGDHTSALFPFTDRTFNYLCTTGRCSLAYAASAIADVYLQPDQDALYDDLIDVKLDHLQPYIHGPFTANRLTRLNQLKEEAKEEEWPEHLSAVSISTTNKTMLDRVARIAKQARQRGLEVKMPFRILIDPKVVPDQMERDTLSFLFESIGAKIIAQPSRMMGHGTSADMDDSKWVSVMATSCKNVYDEEQFYMGNPNSHAFVASPEIVMAMAFAGKLTFNPVKDLIIGRDGIPFRFTPSTKPLIL
ncbi:hypothetical protein BDA99DRAFT_518807 [Phascolomyces articulosus]|uniref:Aconitase/3-isopropylmalate dehydratase large subunit alpha/beta/alpha domain-containing protein n=1 Tax=Phascolomyces articulosus TaxID=60185 RepID=A0AAD5K475_9FUNG|nr:hypothetical protein BDA99DRAFT_518807 [Phascolomyces articulosus]